MKYLTLLKRVRHIGVALVLTCAAVVAAAGVWRSSAFRQNDKAEAKRKFHARVREGVGREVKLAQRGDSAKQIRAAVASVSDFIRKRSGVELSAATQDRVAAMEERAQNGARRRLTASEVGGVVSAAIMERLSALSDQEVAHIDDVLRGFNAPDLPAGFDRDFKLPGGVVFMGTPPEKTVARLKAVRDQLGTPAGDVFAGMARKHVQENTQSKARYLSEAVPEQFGAMWDVANSEESRAPGAGITPLQAVLVAYSLVSDDALSDCEACLVKRMDSIGKNLTKAIGKRYPAAARHRPYGVNGYLFSSPLDVLLDERTVNRLLDRLEERGGA